MTDSRRVLVLAHTGREQANAAAREIVMALQKHQLVVRLLASEQEVIQAGGPVEVVQPSVDLSKDCELAIVLGGDGTLLRAAELTRPYATPLLGINHGHVGFLAEAEQEDLAQVIQAIVQKKYTVEQRMTIAAAVFHNGNLITSTWALNEASVEKAARERMLEVVVEIDNQPLSRWGCDGVVCATPTGSTAYNFSAGGPVVWPEVEALMLVPISAHALFARPMVVSPNSTVAVELVEHGEGHGVLWCDGRRTVELPPGARVEVSKAGVPVQLVRLDQSSFTERLVAKFELPVSGWRGAAERKNQHA